MDPALIAYRLVVEDGRQPPVTYQVKHFDNAMCLALFAAGLCGKEVCNAEGSDDQGARPQADQQPGA